LENKNTSGFGIDASKVGAVAGALVGAKFGVFWAGAGALLGLILGEALTKAYSSPASNQNPDPVVTMPAREPVATKPCPACQKSVPEDHILCMYCGARIQDRKGSLT